MLKLAEIDTAPYKELRGPDLAQAVAQFITDKAIHEDSLNMSEWGDTTSCGTQACFAGWALILTGYDEWQHGDLITAQGPGDYAAVSELAALLIGLPDNRRTPYLFFWAEEYKAVKGDGHDYELDIPATLRKMWRILADTYPEGTITIPEEYRS